MALNNFYCMFPFFSQWKCVHSHSIWFSFASKTGFFRVLSNDMRKPERDKRHSLILSFAFYISLIILSKKLKRAQSEWEKKKRLNSFDLRVRGAYILVSIYICIYKRAFTESTFHFEQFMINDTKKCHRTKKRIGKLIEFHYSRWLACSRSCLWALCDELANGIPYSNVIPRMQKRSMITSNHNEMAWVVSNIARTEFRFCCTSRGIAALNVFFFIHSVNKEHRVIAISVIAEK